MFRQKSTSLLEIQKSSNFRRRSEKSPISYRRKSNRTFHLKTTKTNKQTNKTVLGFPPWTRQSRSEVWGAMYTRRIIGSIASWNVKKIYKWKHNWLFLGKCFWGGENFGMDKKKLHWLRQSQSLPFLPMMHRSLACKVCPTQITIFCLLRSATRSVIREMVWLPTSFTSWHVVVNRESPLMADSFRFCKVGRSETNEKQDKPWLNIHHTSSSQVRLSVKLNEVKYLCCYVSCGLH